MKPNHRLPHLYFPPLLFKCSRWPPCVFAQAASEPTPNVVVFVQQPPPYAVDVNRPKPTNEPVLTMEKVGTVLNQSLLDVLGKFDDKNDVPQHTRQWTVFSCPLCAPSCIGLWFRYLVCTCCSIRNECAGTTKSQVKSGVTLWFPWILLPRHTIILPYFYRNLYQRCDVCV